MLGMQEIEALQNYRRKSNAARVVLPELIDAILNNEVDEHYLSNLLTKLTTMTDDFEGYLISEEYAMDSEI